MRPRPTTLRTLVVAAVPIGLVLSAAVVWQSTAAAFTASTDNAGNTWQAGSVVLTDSDNAAALFDTTRDGTLLAPGSSVSRCIRVDYAGTLPADIRLYVTTPSAGATTLDPYLVVSVERGADVGPATTVAADCTGFTPTAAPTFLYNSATAGGSGADTSRTLGALKTASSDYTSGLHAGSSVAGGTSLTFRITCAVQDDNAAQNTRSKATFTWEARND